MAEHAVTGLSRWWDALQQKQCQGEMFRQGGKVINLGEGARRKAWVASGTPVTPSHNHHARSNRSLIHYGIDLPLSLLVLVPSPSKRTLTWESSLNMAEIAGLVIGAVGIAGLYGTCIQLLDQIDTSKEIVHSANSSIARLAIAVHLLKDWGIAIGIEDGAVRNAHHAKLYDQSTRDLVFRALATLEVILSDQKRLGDRYGLTTAGSTPTTLATQISDKVKEISTTSKDHPSRKWNRRARWAIADRTKFVSLVAEVEVIVSRLYVLIPLERAVTEEGLTMVQLTSKLAGMLSDG
jgi:hypothetical protein